MRQGLLNVKQGNSSSYIKGNEIKNVNNMLEFQPYRSIEDDSFFLVDTKNQYKHSSSYITESKVAI